MNKKFLIVVSECFLVFVVLPFLGVRLWTRHAQKMVTNGDALLAVAPEKALRCYRSADAFYPGGFDAASNRLAFCEACAIGSSDEPNTNAFDCSMYAFLTNDIAFCKALSNLPKQSHEIEVAMLYRTGVRSILSDVLWERLNRLGNDGDLFAQKELAMCYAFGSGCKLDAKLFFQWLKKAADQGDAEACALIGETVANLETYRSWGLCLVGLLTAEAFPHFGENAHHSGEEIAVPEPEDFDIRQALIYGSEYGKWTSWVERALDKSIPIPLTPKGATFAQAYLALEYWPGDSRSQSERVAKLLQDPASTGFWKCSFLLGWLYELGLGVDKNGRRAGDCFRREIKFLRDSVDAKDRKSVARLAEQTDHMALGVALARKFVWDKCSRSMWILGICYENGYGGDRVDKGVALSWYQKAVDNGFAYAKKDVDRLKREGVVESPAK